MAPPETPMTTPTDDDAPPREYASPPCYASEFPGYFGELEDDPSGALAAHLLREMADALIYADRQGIIRAWNPASEALFGHAAAAALGQSLDLIIPEALRPAHWRGFEKALAAGTTRSGRRPALTRALHANGQNLYVEMSFALVRDDSGEVIGSVAVARDATERHQAERALRERLAALENPAGEKG